MSDARRTGHRFPLELPITIRNEKTARHASATTTNVSAAGVYIQADSDLEVGSSIEFEITLPAEVVGMDKDVAIHCKGRVIRMDAMTDEATGKPSNKAGVACVIDQYQFVRPQGGRAEESPAPAKATAKKPGRKA